MFCSTNPLKDIECVYLSVWERDNKRVGERENKIERVCVWERERERGNESVEMSVEGDEKIDDFMVSIWN